MNFDVFGLVVVLTHFWLYITTMKSWQHIHKKREFVVFGLKMHFCRFSTTTTKMGWLTELRDFAVSRFF